MTADYNQLNTEQMAALLDLSPQRLRELTRRGMVPKAGHGRYLVSDAVPAYCRHMREQAAGRASQGEGLDLPAERAKLARAQTVRTQLDIAEKQNLLIRRDLVESHGQKLGQLVIRGLYSLPDRLADELAAQTEAHQVHAVMLGEIDGLVKELRSQINAQDWSNGRAAPTGQPETMEPDDDQDA